MLDSAGYLISFGWPGKGNGLRQGSVSRPLAIPHKRTLSGVGKDRDEAFPFWDHVFAAAAKSIKINVSRDDDTSETSEIMDTSEDPSTSALLRTSTGILSNRRPVSSTPATSGSVTPLESDAHPVHRPSLVAAAKRESARNRLYAGFFRGPVLGREIDPNPATVSTLIPSAIDNDTRHCGLDNRKRKHDNLDQNTPVKKTKKPKKMKQHDTVSHVTVVGEQDQQSDQHIPAKEVKKPKKTKQHATVSHITVAGEREKHPDTKGRMKSEESEATPIPSQKECTTAGGEKSQRRAAKIERRRRKEERRKAKEGRAG